MPQFSFIYFSFRCLGVICQTSSKVDQLQAHPPNNGAGWGDRDPAPNAPVADHLPPKLPEQMQESESSCAHRVEQQRQVQRATIPAPVSIWCNRSSPVWHLSPPKMFWPIFAAAKSNCIKGKSSGHIPTILDAILFDQIMCVC